MNISGYTKQELIKMASTYCKVHRVPYIQHPQCYLRERKQELKIGYLDIEAGGLNANWDYMLTWCIKTKDKKEYKYGVIDQSEILSYDFDKRIIKELIETLKEYDIVITYYGTKYDIPFIRSRAISHKIKFLGFGSVQHKDVYYMVKSKLKIHRNSLESACALVGIKGKNHIKGNYWMRAKVGDTKTLEYVLDHNKKDCTILEKLHKLLMDYVRDTTRSI
jgi:uncharacterized protein YprB with RNaseH-like and TPR domain